MISALQIENLAEPVTLLLGMLGLVWHQNHGTNRLRDELQKACEGTEQARREVHQDNRCLRDELLEARRETQQAIRELQSTVVENGQRLSRIEGFLGIGISGSVTHNAADTAKTAELRNSATATQATHQHQNTQL